MKMSTLREIMAELEIIHDNTKRALGLEDQNRPAYRERGTVSDSLAYIAQLIQNDIIDQEQETDRKIYDALSDCDC